MSIRDHWSDSINAKNAVTDFRKKDLPMSISTSTSRLLSLKNGFCELNRTAVELFAKGVIGEVCLEVPKGEIRYCSLKESLWDDELRLVLPIDYEFKNLDVLLVNLIHQMLFYDIVGFNNYLFRWLFDHDFDNIFYVKINDESYVLSIRREGNHKKWYCCLDMVGNSKRKINSVVFIPC